MQTVGNIENEGEYRGTINQKRVKNEPNEPKINKNTNVNEL